MYGKNHYNKKNKIKRKEKIRKTKQKPAGVSPWLEPSMQSEVRSYSGKDELS